MTSMQIIFIIISISTMLSIIYLIFAFVKNHPDKKINGFIMLFCPFAGLVYFAGQFIIYKLINKEKMMQLDDIGFSKARHNRIANPDMELETQAVPLEEIFLISSNNDKRKHLLSELKKDYISNYGIIIKALDNDDPETSHYAASAITNAKAGFENDLREFDRKYTRNMDDLKLVRMYADYVHDYLQSGILDQIEEKKYKYLLINLLTNASPSEEFLNERDYMNIVNEAISVKEFTIAEHWAEAAHEKLGNESTYLNLLKVYYNTNRIEQFFELLNDMKKSNIPLSHNGLSLVRFFI